MFATKGRIRRTNDHLAGRVKTGSLGLEAYFRKTSPAGGLFITGGSEEDQALAVIVWINNLPQGTPVIVICGPGSHLPAMLNRYLFQHSLLETAEGNGRGLCYLDGVSEGIASALFSRLLRENDSGAVRWVRIFLSLASRIYESCSLPALQLLATYENKSLSRLALENHFSPSDANWLLQEDPSNAVRALIARLGLLRTYGPNTSIKGTIDCARLSGQTAVLLIREESEINAEYQHSLLSAEFQDSCSGAPIAVVADRIIESDSKDPLVKVLCHLAANQYVCITSDKPDSPFQASMRSIIIFPYGDHLGLMQEMFKNRFGCCPGRELHHHDIHPTRLQRLDLEDVKYMQIVCCGHNKSEIVLSHKIVWPRYIKSAI